MRKSPLKSPLSTMVNNMATINTQSITTSHTKLTIMETTTLSSMITTMGKYITSLNITSLTPSHRPRKRIRPSIATISMAPKMSSIILTGHPRTGTSTDQKMCPTVIAGAITWQLMQTRLTKNPSKNKLNNLNNLKNRVKKRRKSRNSRNRRKRRKIRRSRKLRKQ